MKFTEKRKEKNLPAYNATAHRTHASGLGFYVEDGAYQFVVGFNDIDIGFECHF